LVTIIIANHFLKEKIIKNKTKHRFYGNTKRGRLGVSNFFSKSFPNDVESTILGRSEKQRKENKNFLRKKKCLPHHLESILRIIPWDV
jgi:hypothetical protein